MTAEKTLTGRVPREAIRHMQLPPIAPEVLQRFRALEDLTGAVSDAMDDLGLFAAIPATTLTPNLAGARVVGRAVTVRNVERTDSVTRAAASGASGMGEHEAYNLSEPGDVVVIEGLCGVSNMGGQSATLAHQSGCAGVVIDGSHRDPSASVTLGLPVWARGITPITGKWRLRTVEINGRIRVCGTAVSAGDLVVADEAGVLFVACENIAVVLEAAERINSGDKRQKQDIAEGIDLATLADRRYK